MLTIIYDAEGKANADLKSEILALSLFESKAITYTTSTNSLITAFRALIAEGVIPHAEVVFAFEGETLVIDADGQLERGYPKGFCDSEKQLLFRLIDARRKKKNRD